MGCFRLVERERERGCLCMFDSVGGVKKRKNGGKKGYGTSGMGNDLCGAVVIVI